MKASLIDTGDTSISRLIILLLEKEQAQINNCDIAQVCISFTQEITF